MCKGRVAQLRHRSHEPQSLRHLLFGPFGRTCPDLQSRGRDQPLGFQFPPAQTLIIAVITETTHAEVRGDSAVLLFHCCLESMLFLSLILSSRPSPCLQKLADSPLIYHSSVPLNDVSWSLRDILSSTPNEEMWLQLLRELLFPFYYIFLKWPLNKKHCLSDVISTALL